MLAAVAAQAAVALGAVQVALPLAMSFEVALPLGVSLVDGRLALPPVVQPAARVMSSAKMMTISNLPLPFQCLL